MTITATFILDTGFRRNWDTFLKGRPHLAGCQALLCTDPELLTAVLGNLPTKPSNVILACTSTLLLETLSQETYCSNISVTLSSMFALLRQFGVDNQHFRLFLASPIRSPMPTWYFSGFGQLQHSLQTACTNLPENLFVLPFKEFEIDAFEKDGATLKAVFAYEYFSELLDEAEGAISRQSLDTDVRVSNHDNVINALSGRLDVVQQELSQIRHEGRLEMAKSEEERDGRMNERWFF